MSLQFIEYKIRALVFYFRKGEKQLMTYYSQVLCTIGARYMQVL